MKIALDAMGGDYAPLEIIKGAYLAHTELKDIEVILVGKEDLIRKIIKEECPKFDPQIVDAAQKIEMGEPAALSIKRKRNSSIVVGLNLLKNSQAQALVSCGNTGALVCGSVLGVGLIRGVERPGIALVYPTLKGVSLMVDVGANIDPKPNHLLQYALMAEVYSRDILDKPSPSIGLLNIGEEETKGTDFLRETQSLLKSKCSNFIGNIEPKDIFLGSCDCVISDGLVGNIALKVSEGVSETVGRFLVSEVKKDFLGVLGLMLMKRSFRRFRRVFDYAEYGGALLLGVNSVVIIGHGRSNTKAVKNAIRVAARELERNVNKEIEKRINAQA